jgi:hypothetical protein
MKEMRARLGPAAIITPTVAASWLPLSDADARNWLRQNDLIHDLDGRAVVVWGEVVARVSMDTPTQASQTTCKLPRTSLTPL